MCQFPLFETLAIIDGKYQNVFFHQQRIDFAFKHYLKTETTLFIEQIEIPIQYHNGFFRCRIDYNHQTFNIGFYAYQPKEIKTFQCVYVEDFDYQFKYSDRKVLEKLDNKKCDEVIIINNDKVSDCKIGNLLFLKQNKWYSPKDYLLKGTQLSYLIEQNKIQLVEIKAEDLFTYEKIMWINALNPFDPARAIPINMETIFV